MSSPFPGRLDHVAIAAENTVAMMAWYADVLGFAVVREVVGASGAKGFLIGLQGNGGLSSGDMIEVMPRNENARAARQSHDPGLSHLAFYVPDFDAALAHLREKRVEFLGEIVQAMGGGRLISFADLEGNMLQIVERH